MQATIVEIGTGQQHPRTHQLQMQPGRSGPTHVGETGGDDLGCPGEPLAPSDAAWVVSRSA